MISVKVAKDQINTDAELLVRIGEIDIATDVNDKEKFDKLIKSYINSSTHNNIVEILTMLENAENIYDRNKISAVFDKIIHRDAQLYVDVITIIRTLLEAKDSKEWYQYATSILSIYDTKEELDNNRTEEEPKSID